MTPDFDDDGAPLVDQDLLLEIVRALVEHPEEVKILATPAGNGEELRIIVHGDDRRHVIGRDGRMIGLLRNLFAVIAARQAKRLVLEVDEDDRSRRRHRGTDPRKTARAA